LSGHDEPPIAGLERDVAVAADARVDDREQDRVRPHVRERVDEQHRAAADVERRHAVREVDDRARRRDAVHDGVADADPLVAVAEVGEEDDRATGRHADRVWHLEPHTGNSLTFQILKDVFHEKI
jgi:hypothetical protein